MTDQTNPEALLDALARSLKNVLDLPFGPNLGFMGATHLSAARQALARHAAYRARYGEAGAFGLKEQDLWGVINKLRLTGNALLANRIQDALEGDQTAANAQQNVEDVMKAAADRAPPPDRDPDLEDAVREAIELICHLKPERARFKLEMALARGDQQS